MQDRRVQLVIGIVSAIILLCGAAGLLAARRPAPPPIIITQPAAPSSAPTAALPTTDPPASAQSPVQPAAPPSAKYYVHVAGAVHKPSLYLLSPGSRVIQAIKAAGGATSKADLDAINLAEKVKDGEKVYVPIKTTAPTVMLAQPGNEIGHESVDPSSPLSASNDSASSPSATAAKAMKSAKPGRSGAAAKLTSPSQGQVNINTATAGQLQRLPGIGPAMAARILAYRQQAGGFQKIEELQEVTGIGPKKYAKIAPLVKVQ